MTGRPGLVLVGWFIRCAGSFVVVAVYGWFVGSGTVVVGGRWVGGWVGVGGLVGGRAGGWVGGWVG